MMILPNRPDDDFYPNDLIRNLGSFRNQDSPLFNNFIMAQNNSISAALTSITERYAPQYRKAASMSIPLPSETSIPVNHQAIIAGINKFSIFLADRMSVHEQELLNLMKAEIISLFQNLSKTVHTYNKMISEKNLSQELWDVRNEVEYFKFESLRLYKENTSLKKQIQTLREKMRNIEFMDNCKDEALRNMGHKLGKYKTKYKADLQKSRRHNSVIFNTLQRETTFNEIECETTSKRAYIYGMKKGQRMQGSTMNGDRMELSGIKKGQRTQVGGMKGQRTQLSGMKGQRAQLSGIKKGQKIQRSLVKIQNRSKPKPKHKFSLNTEPNEDNPEVKRLVYEPFTPSRQDRINLLKQKLLQSKKCVYN